MHPNPAFRQTTSGDALAIAARRGFGVLAVNGPDGPIAAHVPFEVLDGNLRLHLARSNPILRAGLPLPAVMVVSGPDAYVSPDWYGAMDQVPTWNYIAVHLRGALRALPDDALRPHLDRVSAAFEARIAKKPWTMEKMSSDATLRMTRMIVPLEMTIDSVESTIKLNQNKTPEQRAGAISGIALHPVGMEAAQIAEWMRAK